MINRPHSPHDFAQIAELRWRLKTETLSPQDQPDRETFLARYLDHLHAEHQTGQTIHWVLETAEGVQGVMTVRKVAKETSLQGKSGTWGYLTNVFVSKALRNKKLGTALLTDLINWAKAEHLEFLLVWPSVQSRPFYARAGFQGAGDPLTLDLA